MTSLRRTTDRAGSRRLPVWARVAAPIAVVGLVVAGCGGSNSADTSAAGANTVGTTNDINPQDVSALQDGGDLRIPLSALPVNWNGLTNDGNDADTAAILRPTMPRAFKSDAAGEVSLNTDYFTSIELTSTSPQVVTYTINPKAVWSDGTPLTWEDISSQVNALNGANKDFEVASSSGFERVQAVVRGVDDRQAVMTYKQPYAEWRGLFSGTSFLFPKSATGSVDAFNKGFLDGPAPSAGPFVVTNVDKAQNRVTVARNPKWWGATPKLNSIIYSALDDAAQLPALANNEIDAVGIATIDELKTAQGTAGIALRRAPANSWYHLTFNGAPGSILADQALRTAITKGIDRQGVVTASLNGLADNPTPLGNHVYLAGQEGYQDNSGDYGKYDPEEAKKELDALGWTMNGDVRMKDGKPLEIRDVVFQANSTIQIAQIVQQNLAQIGVKLTIDAQPGSGYFSDFVIPGNFDMTQFSWGGDSFPLSGLSQIYAYTGDNTQGNYGRIGSPEINDLIEKTIAELDPVKARELANEVDKKIWEIGFDVPLQQSPGNIAVRSNLANYGAAGLADYDYTKIGFMK